MVITRCGNFYGAGDLNWNRIVPGTIRSILRSVPPVIRSDGTLVRDYFYVEDGAAAYMHLARQLAINPSIKGEAFNFSNEVQLPVLDLIQLISEKMGSKIEPIILNEVTNEISHQYLSVQKARDILGWTPLFTLDQGLELTIDWYKTHLSGVN